MVDMEAVASGQLQVRTSRTSELSAREEKSQQVPTCPDTHLRPSAWLSRLTRLMNGFHCWSLHQRDAPRTQARGGEILMRFFQWKHVADVFDVFGSEALPPPKKHVV